MNAVIVRKAVPGDLEAVVWLFEAYRLFYACAPDEARARAFIEERLTRADSIILLAEQGGHPAGFVQLFPSFTSAGMARIWILNDLFVAPQSRRTGVAGTLLRAAEELSRQTGAARLTLSTAVTNSAAQRLYESHGWRKERDFLNYNLTTLSA